jgi:hypothetical protein
MERAGGRADSAANHSRTPGVEYLEQGEKEAARQRKIPLPPLTKGDKGGFEQATGESVRQCR